MLLSIFLPPSQDCLVVVAFIGDFFERVTVDFEKCEQRLVEPDSFVVVTVQQAFAVQPRLINQTRQINVTAEFLVRTAWMQSSHEPDRYYVAGNGGGTASWKLRSVGSEPVGVCSPSNSPCANPTCPMASWPENIPPFSTLIAFAVTSPSSEPFL